jgi:uncharacterized protein YmfQ (DUF2313 family)
MPVPPVFGDADYQQAMLSLLPRGRIWRRDPDSVLARLMLALAPAYTRSTQSAAQLLIDADPATTLDLLPEWEASLGLPDSCTPANPTLARRQASVRAKFAARGSLSKTYFTKLAAGLGYAITITEFTPFVAGMAAGLPDCGGDDLVDTELVAGAGRAGDPLMSWPAPKVAWPFAWEVSAPRVLVDDFAAGVNVAGDPLMSFDGQELVCRIRRDAPAETFVFFAFTPGSGIPPLAPPYDFALEDETGALLLEDGSGYLLLEVAPNTGFGLEDASGALLLEDGGGYLIQQAASSADARSVT